MFSPGKSDRQVPARIWAEAKDVYTCNYVVYASNAGVACFDPDHKFPINKNDLKDLFLKNLLVSDGNTLYAPAACHTDAVSEETVITYAKVSNNNIVPATVESYEVPEVVELSTLTLSGCVLDPTFDPETYAYEVISVDEVVALDFTFVPEGADITVTIGDDTFTNPELPLAITLEAGENVLDVKVTGETKAQLYTFAIEYEPPIETAHLTMLAIDALPLVPQFDSETFEYAVATTDTDNTIVFAVSPVLTPVVVKLNDNVVADPSAGVVWEAGENTVTISLEPDGETPVVYTVTVTAQ